MYRRGTSQDGFYASPNSGSSSGLLSPYNMDARRNSDVSAFSLSSFTTYASDYSVPPTPVCERSPFSTESLDATVMEYSHTQSSQMLPVEYCMKDTVFDESLHESWNFTNPSIQMDQAMAVRVHDRFPLHGSFLNPQTTNFIGMDTTVTGVTPSCCSSSSATAYSGLDSPLALHEFNVDESALMPSMCYFQVLSTQTVAPPALDTCTLLGGNYIHVEASHDLETESYDDTDVPLPPSPQDVVFKQEPSPIRVKPEPDTPAANRSPKRSMYETRTGGKSVMKEKHPNSVSKSRTKGKKRKVWPGKKEVEEDEFDWGTVSKGPVISTMRDGKVVFDWDKIMKGPDGKYKYTHRDPEKKFICKHPYEEDDSNIPDDYPGICGKPFQRPEHRQRHRKTHSNEKDYACRLCKKEFGRNDNCWAHWFTHVHRPGKKPGRNPKFSLRQVISVISDPKLIEKLLKAWEKEVELEYRPEEEEEDSPMFQSAVDDTNRMEFLFTYDAEDSIRRIRSVRE